MTHHYFDAVFEDSKADSAFIHESSYIDSPCRIGENTAIMHFSHVGSHSIIGDHCHIGNNVTIAPGVFIANHVKVMNNTMLNSGVILESNVYCGPCTIFTENRLIRSNRKSAPISRVSPTLVRHGAKIGANTTIGSGFTIGQYSFIEAGTVIDGHVPDFAIVYGNPLKFGGWQCQCGQPLPISSKREQQEVSCTGCGKRFAQTSKFRVVMLTEPGIDYPGIAEAEG